MEILEFTVGDKRFGIEVSMAEEIIRYIKVTPVLRSNKLIEGFIMYHDEPAAVIDMFKYAECPEYKNDAADMLICTDFCGHKVAFRVSLILGIKNLAYDNPDEALILPDYEEVIKLAQEY